MSVRQRMAEVHLDCNVVLVGDSRVGKSALVSRFVNNKFTEVREERIFAKRTYTSTILRRTDRTTQPFFFSYHVSFCSVSHYLSTPLSVFFLCVYANLV